MSLADSKQSSRGVYIGPWVSTKQTTLACCDLAWNMHKCLFALNKSLLGNASG